MTDKHARFAPSSMDANLKCTGRVPLIEELVKDAKVVTGGGNVYAYEGTVAHAVAERVLTDWWFNDEAFEAEQLLNAHLGLEWSHYLPDIEDEFKNYMVDQEMLDNVLIYINAVQGIIQKCYDPELFIEHKVVIVEGQCYGTADVIIKDTNDLYVIDLKYGAGVAVSAFENLQALTYLAGAVLGYKKGERKPTNYHAIIIQPRIPSDEPYSIWTVGAGVIADHIIKIAMLLDDVKEGDTKLIEGEHCRWCPAKPVCPQREFVARGFDMQHPPDRMTDNALAESLEWAASAEEYIKSLREYAHDRIKSGAVFIHGWKVVDKRATAKWRDNDLAARVLQTDSRMNLHYDDITTQRTLKTPAQVGKLLSKKDRENMLNDLTEKKSSGTVLVPDADPRMSVAKELQLEPIDKRVAEADKMVRRLKAFV